MNREIRTLERNSTSEIVDKPKDKKAARCRWKYTDVSIEQNHKIGSEESLVVEKSQYQRLMDKLIYLSYIRLDNGSLWIQGISVFERLSIGNIIFFSSKEADKRTFSLVSKQDHC